MPEQPASCSLGFPWRVLLIVAAWLVPPIILGGFRVLAHPEGLLAYLMLFPLGLAALPHWGASPPVGGVREIVGNACLVLAHASYITIIAIQLWTPSRELFWILYIVMLILLVLNVQGCHIMAREMPQIH
jgi:hypothetical protein